MGIGGRTSLFDGPASSLYLPIDTDYTVTAEGTVELAICGARAERSFPPRFISADEVVIEIRGAGNAARQINHIIKPEFEADRLLVVEVFTPSGNWSSFRRTSTTSARCRPKPTSKRSTTTGSTRRMASHSSGSTPTDGRIDEAWTINDGDLLLVPEGYHAFAVAQATPATT